MTRIFSFGGIQELLSVSYYQLFADNEQFNYLMEKLSQAGTLNEERVLLKRADLVHFWGCINCQQIEYKGQHFIYVTWKDISEQIKTEAIMRERNKALEQITIEFDRFIYSASHDMRSPISTIMGLIHLMKLNDKSISQETLIRFIEENLGKLDHFTRKLTFFSRNRSENVKKTRINFNRLFDRVIQRMSKHPRFKEIDFKIEIDSLPILFYATRFRLELILEEIIKNAYDFHDLQKKNPTISVTVKGTEGEVIIRIEDNGSGIPDAFLTSVFDMFYRGSSFSKGAGMGLFIAREAVQKMNGFINLNSELGVGTSVTLKFPFR